MGPEERIIPDEDRLFLTTLGDWTGDAVWWQGAPWWPYYAALFNLTPTKDSAKETLAYPSVLIEANGTGNFRIYFSTWVPPNVVIITLTVSDGNYTFAASYGGPNPPIQWPVEFHFNTPIDWKKENAHIEVKVQAIPPADSSMYFFYPSVIESWTPIVPPTKIDYLPLVGMG